MITKMEDICVMKKRTIDNEINEENEKNRWEYRDKSLEHVL